MTDDVMIRVESLSKNYGKTEAVREVSFQVRTGEIYGLLGPNGAGKTTTISMLSGLLKPSGGRALVGGVDVAVEPERAKSIMGVVPQETAVYNELSARENLNFWGRLYGLRGAELRARVDEALDLVGLASSDRQAVKKFSGGMKRRLNLALGLVHRPKLLLLDEPTVGIDPQGRLKILDAVRQVARDGTTILYTTHYLEEAEQLCERIGILDHGRILAEGTAVELRRLVGEGAVVSLRGKFSAGELEGELRGIEGIGVLVLEDKHALLSITDVEGGASRLLGRVFRGGMEMDEVSVREPSLESVFIKLTGRALRD